MQSTMTKMVTTVPTTNSETMAVRRIFQGMPMEDQLATLMLLRGATASDFHFLLETDSEFADLFATALYEMVKRTVHQKLKSRRCYLPNAHREDLIQELTVHLWKAALGFDPSHGTPFAGYADKFLRRFNDLIKKIFQQRECEVTESEMEANETEDESEGFKLSLFEVCDWCDPEETAIANDLKQKLLEQFSPRQRKSKEIARQILDNSFDTSNGNKVRITQVKRKLREDFLKLNRTLRPLDRKNRRCEKQ